MQSYKKIMPLFLTAALFGSAAFSLKTNIDTKNEYNQALSAAREMTQKGIYADAAVSYKRAIELKPSPELYYEAGKVMLEQEDFNGARKWYNSMASAFPESATTYYYGIQAYRLNTYSSNTAFEIYQIYQDRGLHDDAVEALVDTFRYDYKLAGGFADCGAFSNANNIVAVKQGDLWGYMREAGTSSVSYRFQKAGLFSTLAPVIDENGNAFYIDDSGQARINGEFILEKDPNFGTVKEFGLYQGDVIWAYNGQIWNGYDIKTFEYRFGGYKKVLAFSKGAAAVSKDGQKWFFIDSSGNALTDAIFDEVLVDEKEIFYRAEAIIVRIGKEYKLVNIQGALVTDKTFSDARAFEDASMAAVKYVGKWCYVNENGEIVLETDFDDAKSFSFGFAPVCSNGRWGYIGKDGSLLIPCEFMDAKRFHKTGVAFVNTDGNKWNLLSLYLYNHG